MTKSAEERAKAKIAIEIDRAIIQAGLEDLEMTFEELCEEAGIDPSEVEELRHGEARHAPMAL